MKLLAVLPWAETSLGLLLGAVLGFLMWSWRERKRTQQGEGQRSQLLADAARQAETLRREARLAAEEEALALRRQSDTALAERGRTLAASQERLTEREALINRQLEGLVERERNLRDQQVELQRQHTELAARQNQADALLVQRRERIERLAHLTQVEARALVLKEAEAEARKDAGELTRRIVGEAKARGDEEARRLISLAIQRCASEHTFETTTSTVALNGDDLKGRIIGREGRNIRAFEALTGVTVLIDDTPHAVVLSGFDPVRREVARQAMERLILDGRIHPTRIEEVVARVNQEMEETVTRIGEEAVFKVGLPPLHVELVRLLGRLRFRRSFAQNILDHSIEVAQLAGVLAAELGVDVLTAKRIGLLHDIGKAVDQEIEGSHAAVGADIVRRYGESEEVINGVAAHHDEVPHTSVLGILISAADAISASRPGARSESMETYLKRLERLEQIGATFPGVEKCYAVQAGRELRVIVRPTEVDDDQAYVMARNIARKVENDLQYPGQIRVTVVRETRCVEFAK
ncbi:MAG: ribonuclease Y [Verrucomicrobia bacterium]|nr:ribonuclease Y [Verrucomicrobiota bacterium]